MWQSIKMPGTFSYTLLNIGAPIVMFGTKWPSMISVQDVSSSLTTARRSRTHVQPVGAVVNHALTFRSQVGQVTLGVQLALRASDGDAEY